MRSRAAVTLLVSLTAAIAGCTASTGDTVFGESPAAAQTLTVSGVDPGSSVLRQFEEKMADEGIDVVAGAGSGGASSVELGIGVAEGPAYGHDYACLVAQESWFLVNRIEPPQTVEEAAAHLILDAPETDAYQAAWIAGARQTQVPQTVEFLRALVKQGALIAAPEGYVSAQSGEGPQSGDAGGTERRVAVQSALYPWLTVNNLLTESEWVTVPGSCVEVELRAATRGELGDRFVQFLQSPEGQRNLSEWGLGYSLETGSGSEARVNQIAPRPETLLGSVSDTASEREKFAATVLAELLL